MTSTMERMSIICAFDYADFLLNSWLSELYLFFVEFHLLVMIIGFSVILAFVLAVTVLCMALGTGFLAEILFKENGKNYFFVSH